MDTNRVQETISLLTRTGKHADTQGSLQFRRNNNAETASMAVCLSKATHVRGDTRSGAGPSTRPDRVDLGKLIASGLGVEEGFDETKPMNSAVGPKAREMLDVPPTTRACMPGASGWLRVIFLQLSPATPYFPLGQGGA